jgi:hypothetical protein
MNPVVRLLVLAVIAATGVISAACTTTNRVPSDYTSSVREDFVAGCETVGGQDGLDGSAAYCRCAWDTISTQVPFDEFKRINDQLSADPAPIPPEWQDLLEPCADA